MSMPNSAVFCLCATDTQAENVVSGLHAAGFSINDISILFPDKDFSHEKHTKAPEGATAGAGTGGVLGGTIGLLAGIGSLAIPGLGPLTEAGPVMAALSGAALGAAAGGIAGAIIGLNIPEYEAKRYVVASQDGKILISVHVENDQEKERAKRIFHDAEAQGIAHDREVAA